MELYLELDNNALLAQLVGEKDTFLKRLSIATSTCIALRGNRLLITGKEENILWAKEALLSLYAVLEKGTLLKEEDIDAAIALTIPSPDTNTENSDDPIAIQTKKKLIVPRTLGQAAYMKAILENDLVFGIGPAGTGKTYLAVACAVGLLLEGRVDRLILTRPAVEAGEHLGFLPGDLREKIDPYLRPLFDALHDMLPSDQIEKRIAQKEIEIAPLAYMRGRTLSHAAIILDEAQNTTPMQMKMFLTRLGAHSKMIITGDQTQIDLPKGTLSGLNEAQKVLSNITGISFCYLNEKDVVRHALVSKIIKAYEST